MAPTVCVRRQSGASLRKGQAGSDLVVVAGVGFEDATQIRFAEHQDVVQAFAPDRANEPLDVSVLPGRACRSWMIAYTHRMNAPSVHRPERTVAVTDYMTRRFAPGKGSVTWPAIHSAVGLVVTAILTSRLRAWRRITRP